MDVIKTVAVMGLGYVGLPLVRELARVGFKVIGFDVDQKKIETLESKRSYMIHIPDSLIADLIDKKQLTPTSNPSRLKEAQAILICVPTPLTIYKTPDLKYIKETSRAVAENLQKGQLVVLESTTYPGTTQEVMLPILEKSGLKGEEDFFLAYSPEREDPGNRQYQTGNIPKVVGADSKASLERALSLYSKIAPTVIPMESTREAEAVKILENVYRVVNIALVNELKVVFDRMGINIWKVVEAAATKPFGFQKFVPGPGLGGHCIPIDPFYLAWKARQYDLPSRFIELAGEINTQMPYYVIQRLQEALSDRGIPLKGAKILVLGVAYKKDVDDLRESPALKLLSLLRERKAEVLYHDPHIPRFPQFRHYPDLYMESVPLTEELLASQDGVLIVTNHSSIDYCFVVRHAPLVVDTRNVTAGVQEGREKIILA